MSNAAIAIRQLIAERNIAKKNEAGWKAESKRIDSELAEIVKPESYLQAAGKMKNGGSATVEENGVKFTFEAAKEVKWDSAKLQAVAAKLPWGAVESLFKITFAIPEAVYKQLPGMVGAGMFPAELKAEIDAARTVSVGEAKIKTAEIVTE